MGMEHRTATYDFDHPPEVVAQEPPAQRDSARLLVAQRHGPDLAHQQVTDFPSLLQGGDLVVLNETWVEPAKLAGERTTGGMVSILVLGIHGEGARVLLGSRGRLQAGEELTVAGGQWRLDRACGEGEWEISVQKGEPVSDVLGSVGRMPLPPYISRQTICDPRDTLDRQRYQTTYASKRAPSDFGAVAAPTAGLHFTPDLLCQMQSRGVQVERLSLHVGRGTFTPLRGKTLDDHQMHEERYDIPEGLAEAFSGTRASGGRVVAVGTTVVRALESAVSDDGRVLSPGENRTDLFIRPGHHFGAIDALLTNFHQPRSTLLVLVSAFAGINTIQQAYRTAVAEKYRFFSYGDAMFLA